MKDQLRDTEKRLANLLEAIEQGILTPTKLHYELIAQYGIQPFYRRSFLKKQGYWPEGK